MNVSSCLLWNRCSNRPPGIAANAAAVAYLTERGITLSDADLATLQVYRPE